MRVGVVDVIGEAREGEWRVRQWTAPIVQGELCPTGGLALVAAFQVEGSSASGQGVRSISQPMMPV